MRILTNRIRRSAEHAKVADRLPQRLTTVESNGKSIAEKSAILYYPFGTAVRLFGKTTIFTGQQFSSDNHGFIDGIDALCAFLSLTPLAWPVYVDAAGVFKRL
ncbi:hypothetical protein [Candidatus Symbiopectobacterium sp. NZEC135]|uniref:hypothetical protein n=1 Tax=Candidatus Symbiopectobacterium sp. NZEC135 TaxID=2820471 RepID=UPI002227E4F7|nr:hypothetical protein [Candidatus Symbiopectobacterium sp. NZEC135]MCW2478419.1 hypothetical protein [Candidatus Symbiopectobacterium sp. NZEC135]